MQTGPKQFFEIFIEENSVQSTVELLGISPKDSADDPLVPFYVIHGGLLK